MQLSHNGISFLKQREGFKNKAYQDSRGKWTIGYGTIWLPELNRAVQPGDTCTEPQAFLWMQNHLAGVQTTVNQAVHIALSQDQFDALCSFVYNIGSEAFKNSTFLKKLNAGDFIGAGQEFEKWVYVAGKIVKGQITRRGLERDLFEGHPTEQ